MRPWRQRGGCSCGRLRAGRDAGHVEARRATDRVDALPEQVDRGGLAGLREEAVVDPGVVDDADVQTAAPGPGQRAPAALADEDAVVVGAVEQRQPDPPRHLPQGAPTSPALANLSAYSLDVRLTGFAASWGGTYTRYADDITISGSKSLIRALPKFIPLAERIIGQERFVFHRQKRRVVRDCSRQVVTGVVVNSHPNLSRPQYDRLKAILTNCIRHGPSTQNRENHADFAAWLRGHVAHARNLNPQRGLKLQALYDQVDWQR